MQNINLFQAPNCEDFLLLIVLCESKLNSTFDEELTKIEVSDEIRGNSSLSTQTSVTVLLYFSTPEVLCLTYLQNLNFRAATQRKN